MTSNAKISNPGTGVHDAASSNKAKRKTPPLARIVGGLFAVAGTVAPNTVSRIAKRMMFAPARAKSHEPARSILAMARTEKLTVGGESVCHYIWGESAPRILLVHGWSGDAGHMASFVEPLRQAGYQVVALDLPAHGKSSGNTSSVKHFERCIANAAKAYGPFEGVIAHSLGAAAVAYSLSRGLQVEHVVFFAPISRYDSVWKNSQRKMSLPPKVMGLVVQRAERWLGISFTELEAMRLAPSLSTPLLVVHDRGDRESPFEDGAALVASWPHAKMLATEKMGHTRALRDPNVVQQAIAFVSGQSSKSP